MSIVLVSATEHGIDPHHDEFLGAGCTTIMEEHAPGADRTYPAPTRLQAILRVVRPWWPCGSIALPAPFLPC